MEIVLEHISKKYKNRNVLKDVSIELESGKCVGVLGGNGCGKSTLLSVLAGIRNPDSGSFKCDGRDLFKDSALRSRILGYVPQGTPLLEELSARDNLSIFYNRKDMERELEGGTLKLLGINEYINVPVKKMSGGMKKRLSIGCAVANRPSILILDEPSAALDIICKQAIYEYIKAYKKAGGAVIIVTHDENELALCDKWYIIKDGIAREYKYDGNVSALIKNF